MFSGKMPDITPAQIVAVIGNVIAVAVAFGLHLSKQQEDAILAVAGALGSFLIVGDAHLRGRRALAQATVEAANAVVPPPPPAPAVVPPAVSAPEVPPAPAPTPDVAPAQQPSFASTLLGQ
jgi:outer membrane biosynthesis protein TonB